MDGNSSAMTTLQERNALGLDIISKNLCDLLYLPDAEAAEALNARMGALNMIHRIHARSYSERGVIALEFERRHLWKHLMSPETGEPFPNFSAWMSCADFLGCRRVNFESLRDIKILDDIPEEKLIDLPKGTIKFLTQLSTSIRTDDAVLEAARTMKADEFADKIEAEHPFQHVEARKPMRFSFGRSQRQTIDKWITWALEHDVAGSREEAIERACETALNDARLDEELRTMAANEAAHP